MATSKPMPDGAEQHLRTLVQARDAFMEGEFDRGCALWGALNRAHDEARAFLKELDRLRKQGQREGGHEA